MRLQKIIFDLLGAGGSAKKDRNAAVAYSSHVWQLGLLTSSYELSGFLWQLSVQRDGSNLSKDTSYLVFPRVI